MQLRGFRNTIRHRASTRRDARYAARHEEHSSFGIGVEGWSGGAEEQRLGLYIYGEAGVPVGGRGRVQVGEGREARPALRGGDGGLGGVWFGGVVGWVRR
jgi:hypothetical protein